jgi:hypothetical protein
MALSALETDDQGNLSAKVPNVTGRLTMIRRLGAAST